MSCVFCKIFHQEIPAQVISTSQDWMMIEDINPQAPIHWIVFPKLHIPSVNDLTPDTLPLISQLYGAAQQAAQQHSFAEAGYRLVMNVNTQGGQTVPHIHLHILGGRPMIWPPG